MSMTCVRTPFATTSLRTPKLKATVQRLGVKNSSKFLNGGSRICAFRRSNTRPSIRSRSTLLVHCSKVSLLGASGGIGQPLALLLKMNKLVTELALYDIANTEGVAADLSHCNTPVKVTAHTGKENIEGAVAGADLIIIPAGIPRKPGMTRDDLFNINAGIVFELVEACAKFAPSAMLNIISNPINSTVAIAAEALKAAGVYDPKKLIGVTTLDVVRSNTFIADAKSTVFYKGRKLEFVLDLDVKDVDVPVIGGHAGKTILPLLSQTSPAASFTDEEIEKLTVRIQNAGTEVVEAKAGAGSATLSMAYAAARMAESCLLGLQGEPDIYECAFVQSNLVPELDFFASKVQLGRDGVAAQLPLGDLSDSEKEGLKELIPLLQGTIEKGIKFADAAKVKA